MRNLSNHLVSSRCLLCCALGLVLLGKAAWAGAPSRFAIVVGNNRPERADAESLHYADDDALATHRLLVEAKVASILLARLDDDTRRLADDVRPSAPPRRDALETAFAAQAEAMHKAIQSGARSEFFFFYSGHGDVDDGEGYAVLEDGRFTRTALAELLARSPAARNHVIIDSCKSYFLAFDKGAGGRRTAYGQHFVLPSMPARLANTGFILSTSSARDSHEWERFQGGILSHEVRSALRGAADLNRDGHVTYAELGAFVTSANRNIDNPRFRPTFTVRPPAGKIEEVLFDWPAELAVVGIEAKALGHIYVEAEHGERILDAHPNESQTLALHLPPVRPLFIRRNDDKAEFILATTGASTVTELQPVVPRISRKGALDLAFEQIFTSTFGPQDLREFSVRAESLVDSSQPPARDLSTIKTILGVTALASAAAGVVLGGLAVREYVAGADAPQSQIDAHNRALVPLRTASVASFALAGVTAIAWALIPPARKAQVFVGPELGGGAAMLDLGGRF